MNKIFYFFSLSSLIFSSGYALTYDDDDVDAYKKEVYERRLQDRLFNERRATEIPKEIDYDVIQEKKREQGWDDDNWADNTQDRINAAKRQAQEVEQKRLQQKRIEEKVLQQKLEQKRVEDRIYQQQLENKRLDDARWRRQQDDRDWDRRHGR